jgi:hypothetical protein
MKEELLEDLLNVWLTHLHGPLKVRVFASFRYLHKCKGTRFKSVWFSIGFNDFYSY